jgi:NADH dehydrogenase
MGELAHTTLKHDFQHIDPAEAKILLLEGTERVLPAYPAELSAQAEAALAQLGVTVYTNTLVTNIADQTVTIRQGEQEKAIQSRTVLWAAGMKASALGQILAERTGAEVDRAGRVMIGPDLSLKDNPNIFVIGDLAHLALPDGKPLPGVAPVATQQGRYVAEQIMAQLNGQNLGPFYYHDKGSLAVVGRNAAVVDLGRLKFAGFPAWLVWLFIHIWYLIEFDNKLMVMFQWAWNYFSRKRGARLITGADPFPLVEPATAGMMAQHIQKNQGSSQNEKILL